MKKHLSSLVLAFGAMVSAQVGINTTEPKSTLDINVKRDTTGVIVDHTQLIGLQSPRITRAELTLNTATYGADQKGAMLYITDITAGDNLDQRVNVIEIGYYYFDGLLWQKFENDSFNIYNTNGSLTDYRILSLNTNPLLFEGVGQSTLFSDNGLGVIGKKRASITLDANDTGDENDVSQLSIYVDSKNAAQVVAYAHTTQLAIGTTETEVSAPLQFFTSSGGFNLGENRAEIAGDGKFNIVNTLSVGYVGQQDFLGSTMLKVNGNIETVSKMYPDYVFENYADGFSSSKPNYAFTNIYDTEKFILQNKHLPGVTPISALEKTTGGYLVNITDLSIQSLEKLEELYLHVINQQKQLDQQKSEIEALTKLVNSKK